MFRYERGLKYEAIDYQVWALMIAACVAYYIASEIGIANFVNMITGLF
jgi:hypothetical protein